MAGAYPNAAEFGFETPVDKNNPPLPTASAGDSDIGPVPEGLTPTQWKYMDPEKRKLWQN